jgi:hypothetical protein
VKLNERKKDTRIRIRRKYTSFDNIYYSVFRFRLSALCGLSLLTLTSLRYADVKM